jgi:protein-S-isoprenylcysteine O-methyltransferase Ste14
MERSVSSEPKTFSPERCFNFLLGGTFFVSAVSGIFLKRHEMPLAILVATSSLFLTLTWLSVFRRPAVKHGSQWELAAAIPSIVIGIWVFKTASHDWMLASQVTFVAGCLFAIWSFVWLGKSFAVLPAARGIVTRGPYRWIRHPAYVGELLMALACCFSIRSSMWLSGLMFCLIVFVWLRIRAEENLLMRVDPTYAKYCEHVPWRLIPRVY